MLKIVSSALALLLVFSHGAVAESEIKAALGKMDMTATMIRPSPVRVSRR